VLTTVHEPVESDCRVACVLVVEPLDVVLADRPQHECRGQVTLEHRVHAEQVLGQEATRQVGQLAAMCPHELRIQLGHYTLLDGAEDRSWRDAACEPAPGLPEMGSLGMRLPIPAAAVN